GVQTCAPPISTSWEARDAGPLRPAPLHSTGIPAGSAIETIGARRNRRRQAESSAPDGTGGARRSRRRQAEPAEPGGVVGARRNRRSQTEPAASGGTGGARRNRPRQATPPRALGDLRIRNSPNARGLGTGTRTPRTAAATLLTPGRLRTRHPDRPQGPRPPQRPRPTPRPQPTQRPRLPRFPRHRLPERRPGSPSALGSVPALPPRPVRHAGAGAAAGPGPRR